MKVFIGTMESGEIDFPECIKSIRSQTHKDSCHFVVSGLTEPEAHERLYEAWNEAKSEFDIFLKVDADTVLLHNNVVADIVTLFETDKRLTGIQAWLYDYISDRKIFGLGCMKNSVPLRSGTHALYPDRVDEYHDKVLRGDELPLSLNPAGNHCMHPSNRQAFHYGLHRTLKNQHEAIACVKRAWLKEHDHSRGFVLLGSMMAHQFASHLCFNYLDQEFESAFQIAEVQYESLLKGIK